MGAALGPKVSERIYMLHYTKQTPENAADPILQRQRLFRLQLMLSLSSAAQEIFRVMGEAKGRELIAAEVFAHKGLAMDANGADSLCRRLTAISHGEDPDA